MPKMTSKISTFITNILFFNKLVRRTFSPVID